MSVNWGLGVAPDVGGTFMNAFNQGQQQRKQEQAQNALTAYAQNPNEETLNAVAQYDPQMAIQERARMQAQLKAMSAEQRKMVDDRMKVIGEAAQWADTPEKWDQAIDYLTQSGYEGVDQYKGKFSPQLRESAIASAGQWKTYLDQTAPVTVGPGSHLVDPATGKPKFSAPFAPRPVSVGPGETVVEYAPGAGSTLTVDSLLPHIVAQESRGQYTARNPETGAMGAYQVMPATGQALAERAGMPWRPDLMASDTPQGRKYQDVIGRAAVQEAVDNSGGDVAAAAAYYHGGSDRSKWGPRTQKYAEEVSARFGGGKPRVIAQGTPKPAGENAPSGYRYKPDGTLEPIPGGPADKPEKGAEAYSQSAMDAFNRAISSADRLLKHPGLESRVGVKGVTGGLLGGWLVPGTDAADFDAELEAMKAQVFLPMVQSMKGMGALSNAEGEKLTASIGALNPKMSESGFKASLNRIITDLKSYRDRANKPAPTASKSPQASRRRVYNPKTGELE
jgi:hypothetical protein